jgi:hypothetical protein
VQQRGLANLVLVVSTAACWPEAREPGYGKSEPGTITCGCHDGTTCFEETGRIAEARGETAESAEDLLYYSQCACFQGSVGGCNTLGHFAKDSVRWCEAGNDVAKNCTIAGLVYYHGVQVPRLNGRSFDRDPARASAAFDRACRAGSQVACAHVVTP